MNGCGGWRLVKREVRRLGTTKDRRGMSEQEGRENERPFFRQLIEK